MEFALLTPFLVAMLVASVELAGMYNRSQELEGAARAGARHATEESTTTKDEVIARVTNALEVSAGRR